MNELLPFFGDLMQNRHRSKGMNICSSNLKCEIAILGTVLAEEIAIDGFNVYKQTALAADWFPQQNFRQER